MNAHQSVSIVMIEDDEGHARLIERNIRRAGVNNEIVPFRDGTSALAYLMGPDGTGEASAGRPLLILLDLNLPDMSGYEVLRTLRLAKVKTPILILSGMAGIEDKVRGLGFGADDYMTKPFHRDELIARSQAIIRRSKGHSQAVIRTGRMVVNIDARSVEVDGKPVNLTEKAERVLAETDREWRRRIAARTADWSPEELRTFATLIDRYMSVDLPGEERPAGL